MRISSVMLLALVTCAVLSAQSQPPTPGNGSPKGQPQTQEAPPTQTEPAPIQTGTETNPLIIRELRSETQATEDRQDREDERANRRQSFWLSVVTLLVLAFQVWLLVRQNTIIGKQNEIMEGQRTAANTQSTHMEAGLTVAANAASAAKESADAAKQAANTADRSLVLLNRPYLDTENWRAAYTSSGRQDAQISVFFEVTNRSATPAFVQSLEISDDAGNGASEMNAFSIDRLVEATIGPRNSQPFTHDVRLSTEQWGHLLRDRLRVVVSGTIRYTDVFSGEHTRRVKHFCRIGVLWCVEDDDANFAEKFRFEFHTPVGLDFTGRNDEEETQESQGQSEDQP